MLPVGAARGQVSEGVRQSAAIPRPSVQAEARVGVDTPSELPNPERQYGPKLVDRDILGFASYDLKLSDSGVAAHHVAFVAVPEPSTLGVSAVAGIGLLSLRRARGSVGIGHRCP